MLKKIIKEPLFRRMNREEIDPPQWGSLYSCLWVNGFRLALCQLNGVPMKRKNLFVALGIGMFALWSCTRPPIERAVNRELLPSEANIIVTSHCQGCHVHSRFNPDAHLLLVKQKYSADNPLREATECLQCHVLKLENYFRKEFRSTHRPHGQLVQIDEIPKPDPSKASTVQKTAVPKEAEKKKWYFFYLF